MRFKKTDIQVQIRLIIRVNNALRILIKKCGILMMKLL